MSDTPSFDLGESTPHMVLDRPWTYKGTWIAVNFDEGKNDVQLEMRLRKDNELITLVFFGVHELEIEAGFPWLGSGMEILDESSGGMENSRVRVSSFEQDPAIRFWAREVERVNT